MNTVKEPQEENLKDLNPPIRWNDKTKQLFTQSINSNATKMTINKIEDMLRNEDNSQIDDAIQQLNDIYALKGLWKRNKGKKNNKKKSKKWYDKTCAEMSRRLKALGKLCERDPNNPFLRGNMIKARKEYRKLIKLKKHQWRDTMIKKLEEVETKNPTEYWKIIKEMKERKANNKITNPEEFEQFFKNLFADKTEEKTNKEMTKRREDISNQVMEMLNKPNKITQEDYSLEELKTAIKKLKTNKSSVMVPAEMLKASPDYILKVLLKIANRIKNSSYFPYEWAKGITTLLHKEGKEEDPNNYRAITVADALSKVMTIMINERIIDQLEKEKIINPQQIGFTKKARPADHVFVLKNVFEKYLTQGKKVYICFVDFQKAYDNVWRNGLYYKLITNGIDIGTVKLIKDMYDKTSQIIKINGKATRALQTHRGVRQGCVLSPQLFNIFLNDLPGIFNASCKPVKNGNTSLSCLMFADDIVLLSESKEGLQRCLNKLEAYADEWDMTVNKKKTKIMIIQNRGKAPSLEFQYKGENLEVVNSYKYLGTIINRTGTFKLNDVYLKNKGLKARYAITRTIGIDCKVSLSIKLFQQMVEPILLYNCEVAQAYIPATWDQDKFRKKMWDDRETDKVLKGFLRSILGVNKKSVVVGLRGETGKFPLSLNIYTQVIKYWIRLLSTESTLLQEAHLDNVERIKKGQQCWLTPVIYILKICGTDQIDIMEICKNKHAFLKHIKDRLKELYQEEWKSERRNKIDGKLSFYWEVKRNFQFEGYLDKIQRNDRKEITKLRLSAHKFPIEVMRYGKEEIERGERKCTVCTRNEVGDEWHYLTKCTNQAMKDTREQFIHNVKLLQPQLQKFDTNEVMKYSVTMHDELLQMETALFVKKLMKVYSDRKDEERSTCSLM